MYGLYANCSGLPHHYQTQTMSNSVNTTLVVPLVLHVPYMEISNNNYAIYGSQMVFILVRIPAIA